VELFNRFKALRSPINSELCNKGISISTSTEVLPKVSVPSAHNSKNISRLQADESNLVLNDQSIQDSPFKNKRISERVIEYEQIQKESIPI
jgi:hypothetical protein